MRLRVFLVVSLAGILFSCVPDRRVLPVGDGDAGKKGGFDSTPPSSCRGWRATGVDRDGVQLLTFPGDAGTALVYCDMTTDGGGWTLVATRSSRTYWTNWVHQIGIGHDLTDPSSDTDNALTARQARELAGSEIAYDLDDYRYRLVLDGLDLDGVTKGNTSFAQDPLSAIGVHDTGPVPDSGPLFPIPPGDASSIDPLDGASDVFSPPPMLPDGGPPPLNPIDRFVCLAGAPSALAREPRFERRVYCSIAGTPPPGFGQILDPHASISPCYWAQTDRLGAGHCEMGARPGDGAKGRLWVR